jgi:threonine synthase
MAQIVYYFNACASLGADESHKISFAVPTGNFGNVYAAYCAKKMGAPIDRLIIGSNRNDILTRFFETGKMTTGEVEPSLSPSMDIQVSSNFERFLFDLCSRDGEQVKSLMDDLKSKGEYALSNEQMLFARQMFESSRCDDERTSRTMSETHKKTGYLLDPHTAVGVHSAKTANMGDKTVVALACAHPAKFPDAVKSATDVYPSLPPHMADLYNREEFVTTLPNNLAAIQKFIKQKAL